MTGSGGGPNIMAGLRGVIFEGVHERLNAQQMWGKIRADLGLPETGPTGVPLQTFNAIWHDAVSSRNVTDRFARAQERVELTGIDAAIDHRMLAVPSWARDPQARNNAPIFQVNFRMDMTDENGNPDSTWSTVIHRGHLPPTVSALTESLAADAEMLADRYGKSLESVESIQILAI